MATAAKRRVIPPPPTGEGLTFEKVWAMFQETDRKFQETRLEIAETARISKENSKNIGGLNRSFGQLAEHLVAPGIVERFNELGFHFSYIVDGHIEILDEQRNVLAEVDILLENGEYAVAVEVKARPTIGDVKDHVKRLKILRGDRDKRGDRRKIRGAIAGAIFPKSVKEAAHEAGLYVLKQSGDTMRMELPEGFKPGEW